MSRVDLDEAQFRADLAHAEVGEIAAQGAAKRWRMSIPAQPDRDSDLIIVAALKDTAILVAELRAAREACHALERWVAIPGMFWGDTPETGSEVGAALTNWQKVTGESQ